MYVMKRYLVFVDTQFDRGIGWEDQFAGMEETIQDARKLARNVLSAQETHPSVATIFDLKENRRVGIMYSDHEGIRAKAWYTNVNQTANIRL